VIGCSLKYVSERHNHSTGPRLNRVIHARASRICRTGDPAALRRPNRRMGLRDRVLRPIERQAIPVLARQTPRWPLATSEGERSNEHDGDRSEDPNPSDLTIHVRFHSCTSKRLELLIPPPRGIQNRLRILLSLHRDRRPPAFARDDVLHAAVHPGYALLRSRLPAEDRRVCDCLPQVVISKIRIVVIVS